MYEENNENDILIYLYYLFFFIKNILVKSSYLFIKIILFN